MTDAYPPSRYNPFRRSWSVRVGRVRVRSVPWYWDVMRERLASSSHRRRPVAPSVAHHDHYCQECDRRWVHEGHTCPAPWAARCPERTHQSAAAGPAPGDRWLIVVRHDRTDLCRRLDESFEADQRVTVVLDRRQSERRAPRARKAPGAAERRRSRDRRMSQTDEARAIWGTLGFRVQQIGDPQLR